MWYNDEDDVLFDKKTHAVMGLDTLSDNIIKAKSTDDDEELFDANKFLELMNTLTLTWV